MYKVWVCSTFWFASGEISPQFVLTEQGTTVLDPWIWSLLRLIPFISQGYKKGSIALAQATSVQEKPMAISKRKSSRTKLEELRKLMSTADGGKPIHAYVIPTEDPHMVRKNSSLMIILSLISLQKLYKPDPAVSNLHSSSQASSYGLIDTFLKIQKHPWYSLLLSYLLITLVSVYIL